jgi:hypothetical protein
VRNKSFGWLVDRTVSGSGADQKWEAAERNQLLSFSDQDGPECVARADLRRKSVG